MKDDTLFWFFWLSLVLVFLMGLWLAQAHGAELPCYVHGRVYVSPIAAESELKLDMLCPAIRFSMFERLIVMETERFRVEVEIPGHGEPLQGWVLFSYIWGRTVAHVGTALVPVNWMAAKPIENN